MTPLTDTKPSSEPQRSAAPPVAAPASAARHRLAFVAPRHRGDPRWPWITQIGPMRSFAFRSARSDNTFRPLPKLTRFYQWWQYTKAAWIIRSAELVFLFSDDVAAPLTAPPARLMAPGRRVYVGFTQDGHWPQARMDRFARLLRRCDAVTMFTAEERDIYLERYGLDASRVHVIPIHTDETDDYRQYDGAAPRETPYVLSLGSPNRRFMPVARACGRLGVPLVIITRPWHKNDALDELADMGAEVITDANKLRALTYLKHARLAVAAFDDPTIPGGFTTLVHAMFLATPFVLTQCLGMAEHVIDGETGFITPHGDEDALREAIDRLWQDDALAARFGQAAQQRGHARHSLDAAAEAFSRLALQVIGAPADAGQA
jgi:glycosyltransferase involved in cell wall biosynthesis